jgi:multiple sugar transport system permease protein
MSTGISVSKHLATAHSIVEPGPWAKRIAGTLVILYALITMIPLFWIVTTSMKSPPDSISYPPKILSFTPTIEGYCNLFTTLAPDQGIHRKPWASDNNMR